MAAIQVGGHSQAMIETQAAACGRDGGPLQKVTAVQGVSAHLARPSRENGSGAHWLSLSFAWHAFNPRR
jgi:hypothetical protein